MSRGLIIFDFDGTLGDTRRNIVTTMQMTIKELHLPNRSDEECAATIGLPLAGCFRTLFPDIQEELIPRCAETYRRFFNENLKTIHPEAFPDVVETLAILHQKGFTLTIASSRSHNSLTELTRKMGIADYISYILGADDVKEAKPKPEPVLKTLADMHFDAGETLVVGDMAVDILMGANAGARTCGVTWGNGTKDELEDAGADYIVNCINELIGIVEKNESNNRIMKSFKSTAWLLPQPVLIIGNYDKDGKPNAMNAAWGGQWDMHEIIISLGSHQTTDNLVENPEFTVAFATTETMVASDYVGIVSGRNTPGKMEKTGWNIEKAPNVNAPVFKEFPMTLECRVKQKIDESETGYYLVAEIVNILCDEKYLAEDGKPDVEKMELITFDPVHHTYIQLGKTVGNAFSDGKQLK